MIFSKKSLCSFLLVIASATIYSNEPTYAQTTKNALNFVADKAEDAGLTTLFATSSLALGGGLAGAYAACYYPAQLQGDDASAYIVACILGGFVGLTTSVKAINTKMTLASLKETATSPKSEKTNNVLTFLTDRIEELGLLGMFGGSSALLAAVAYEVYGTKIDSHTAPIIVGALTAGAVGLTTAIRTISNKIELSGLKAKLAENEQAA